jgi:hypothetical protein
VVSAAALARSDEPIEVFLAVVVGKLVARFDSLLGVDKDARAVYLRLTIWPAGVIYVARSVAARAAVPRQLLINREEILAAFFVCLSFPYQRTEILNDKLPLLYFAGGEQAQTGTAALNF